MTRAQQVRRIRFYMLAGLALWLCCFWPDLALYLFAGFAWVPLGLFMPVLGCTVSCARCSPADSAHCVHEVTLAGIANGSCATCTTKNGTFQLSVYGGSCDWQGSTAICGGSVPLRLIISSNGTARVFLVNVTTVGFGDVFRFQDAAGTDGTSCDSISASLTVFGSNSCNLTSATCSIVSA
jgi:hypothetical protein